MTLAGEPKGAVARERLRQLRGLLDPNPSNARAHGLPGVMASPPAVTLGTASAASAITIANGAVGNGVDIKSTVGDNGTATNGGAATLTDSAKSWGTLNQYRGYQVTIWSGTGAGQVRAIGSHTNNAMTVTVPWTTVPDTTSVYGFWNVRVHRDWRFLRANPIVRIADPAVSNQSRDRNVVVSTVTAYNLPLGSGTYAVEFMHWGDQFEVRTHGQAGNQWRLMVDGAYVQYAPYAATAVDGLVYRHRVDFAGGTTDAPTRAGFRKLRRILFEAYAGFSFFGLTLGPTDSIWAPSTPIRPKAVLVADSYGLTGGLAPFTAFGYTLGKLLGLPNMQVSGVGGSGYTVDGLGVRYGPRIAPDVVARNPDLVFIYGSQNDSGAGSAITTAATAVYQAIGAGLPGVPLIVIGPTPLSGSPSASTIQSRDALMAAALDPANPVSFYIDLAGGPYPYSGSTGDYVNVGLFRGTGKVSTPSGSGNMDEFYGGQAGTDPFHPTQAGHDAIAQFVAGAIAEWISAGCPRAYWMPGAGLVRI